MHRVHPTPRALLQMGRCSKLLPGPFKRTAVHAIVPRAQVSALQASGLGGPPCKDTSGLTPEELRSRLQRENKDLQRKLHVLTLESAARTWHQVRFSNARAPGFVELF